jgi:hypothetical protein
VQRVRALVEEGRSLPENDRMAQLARALSVLGVLVHVPDGVQLAEPLVIRWSGRCRRARADDPDAGRHRRRRGGQDPRGAGPDRWTRRGRRPARRARRPPRACGGAPAEVHLADGATLDFAGQQDFGPSTLAFVNRHATLERDAQLRWALASVGGQLHKSRIDNRLVGRGSSVQQAEIGFGAGSQLFDLTSTPATSARTPPATCSARVSSSIAAVATSRA